MILPPVLLELFYLNLNDRYWLCQEDILDIAFHPIFRTNCARAGVGEDISFADILKILPRYFEGKTKQGEKCPFRSEDWIGKGPDARKPNIFNGSIEDKFWE